jgi:hypothetical protein
VASWADFACESASETQKLLPGFEPAFDGVAVAEFDDVPVRLADALVVDELQAVNPRAPVTTSIPTVIDARYLVIGCVLPVHRRGPWVPRCGWSTLASSGIRVVDGEKESSGTDAAE